MANKSVDYDTLYEQVIQHCTRRGMSRRMAAAEMGIPVGTITRIKNGQGMADSTFATLMDWLGMSESIQPFLKDNKPKHPATTEEAADEQE